MSAVPPPYSRQASFTGFSTEQSPTVGQNLEAEFNKIDQVLDATQARLSEVQRDDGRLANDSVHPDALSQGVRALLSISGEIRGAWQTGLIYDKGDVISGPDGVTYLSADQHVASAVFADDVTAGRWLVLDSGKALDATLRANLAAATGTEGASLVGYAGTTVKGRLDAIGPIRTDLAAAIGSSLVGFQQLGSGASARTALAKMREWVSVKDFGAVGDGAADDTAAIQLAFDYATSTGKALVRIVAGIYKTTAPLSIPPTGNDIEICGDGLTNTLIAPAFGALNNAIVVGTNGVACRNVIMRNFSIGGSGDGSTTGGILCYDAARIRFNSVGVFSTKFGLRLYRCYAARFRDCFFRYIRGEQIDMLDRTGNGAVVDKCEFYDSGILESKPSVVVSQADNATIMNSAFETTYTSLSMVTAKVVRFINNYSEGSFKHFAFDTAIPSGAITSKSGIFICEGNWLGAKTDASVVENCELGIVRNNAVYQSTISVGATADNYIGGNNHDAGSGVVAGTKWIAPTFQNSWANRAGSTTGYRKDENNIVHLRGTVSDGTVSQAAFTLPAGYRPSQTLVFACSNINGQTGLVCQVLSDGRVFISAAGSNGISLDSISFAVGQ